jgi:hypothetical protein
MQTPLQPLTRTFYKLRCPSEAVPTTEENTHHLEVGEIKMTLSIDVIVLATKDRTDSVPLSF